MKTKISILASIAAALTLCSCTDDYVDGNSELPAAGTPVQFALGSMESFAETRTKFDNTHSAENYIHLIWSKGDSVYVTCKETTTSGSVNTQCAHYKTIADGQDATNTGFLSSLAVEGEAKTIRWGGDDSQYLFRGFYAPNGLTVTNKNFTSTANTVTFTMPELQDSTTMEKKAFDALKNTDNKKMHAKYCALWSNTISTMTYQVASDGSITTSSASEHTQDAISKAPLGIILEFYPVMAVVKFVVENYTANTYSDVALSLKHSSLNLSGTFTLSLDDGTLTNANSGTTGLSVKSPAATTIAADSSQVYMLCLPLTENIESKDLTLTVSAVGPSGATSTNNITLNVEKSGGAKESLTIKPRSITTFTIMRGIDGEFTVTTPADDGASTDMTIEQTDEIQMN